jgi:hypothetical protein
LIVDGPVDVLEGAATALAADKQALELVVEVFGPVEVLSANTRAVWSPPGGFDPSQRRLTRGLPLVVLPSEHGAIDPYADEPPTLPCPVCTVEQVHPTLERTCATGPWQSCSTCGGRQWHTTAQGDVCVACGPPSYAIAPSTWVRCGSGWTCSRCHPPARPYDREVCPICGGKGQCRPDHDSKLRLAGEKLLRRTRSVKKRAAIEHALAALPASEEQPPDPLRRSRHVQGWVAPTVKTGRQQKEVVWGRQCRECCASGATHKRVDHWWVCSACHAAGASGHSVPQCRPSCPGCARP